MRCLVVAASMVLPTDELAYDDTWIHLFWKRFRNIELVVKATRGSSVTRLSYEGPASNGKDVLEYYNPDIAILHIGLTDASPRFLPRKKLWVKLLNMTIMAKPIYNFLRKYRGRKIEYNDVSIEQFKEELEKYCKRTCKTNTKVIIIEISNATKGVELDKSPLINKSISKYNLAIAEIASRFKNVFIVEGIKGNSTYYQSDGYHLNKEGQSIIFKKIEELIVNLFPTIK